MGALPPGTFVKGSKGYALGGGPGGSAPWPYFLEGAPSRRPIGPYPSAARCTSWTTIPAGLGATRTQDLRVRVALVSR